MITDAYTNNQAGFFEDEDEGVFNYSQIEGVLINTKSPLIESFKERIERYEDRTGIYNNQIKEYKEEGITKIDQHSPGAKLDNEKPALDLVLGDFAKALQEVGKVGHMGAKKYSEHGWLSVERGETRYLSAGLRHYFFYREGEEVDPESGLPHLAHHAWNALAVLELYLRKNHG